MFPAAQSFLLENSVQETDKPCKNSIETSDKCLMVSKFHVPVSSHVTFGLCLIFSKELQIKMQVGNLKKKQNTY